MLGINIVIEFGAGAPETSSSQGSQALLTNLQSSNFMIPLNGTTIRVSEMLTATVSGANGTNTSGGSGLHQGGGELNQFSPFLEYQNYKTLVVYWISS